MIFPCPDHKKSPPYGFPVSGGFFLYSFAVLGSKKSPLRNAATGILFLHGRSDENAGKNYFFWTYFRQSSITATRMMMPEKTNWRFVSMPRVVRE